nr:hypothetical protein [uncultured Clostridium sp.]
MIITTPGNPKNAVIITEIPFMITGISINCKIYNAISPKIPFIAT